MMIAGVEVSFYQKKIDTNERYYQILVSSVKTELRKITKVVKVMEEVSKTTDSIYFNVTLEGLREKLVVSLRTHRPKDMQDNYIYFYLPKYESLGELTQHIVRKVSLAYNIRAEKEGLGGKAIIKESKTISRSTHKKKKKVSKWDDKHLDNPDFNELLKELNGNAK